MKQPVHAEDDGHCTALGLVLNYYLREPPVIARSRIIMLLFTAMPMPNGHRQDAYASEEAGADRHVNVHSSTVHHPCIHCRYKHFAVNHEVFACS